MNNAERKARLKALGYGLKRGDGSGWYKTFPVESAGTTNYHRDLPALDRYIQQVEEIRSFQE